MKINILEMPLDFGANRHGSDMGPSAIRLAGLTQKIEKLNHTIERHFSPMNVASQEYEKPENQRLKYMRPIITACNQLAKEVEESVTQNIFPLILGGDHSITLGTLAGLSNVYKKEQKKIGVLYVDAHGDFNTHEITPSGNIHGMSLAASCGFGTPELVNLYSNGQKIDAKNICYIGLRDLDDEEKTLMKKAGVNAYTISDVERYGFAQIIQKITKFFKSSVDIIHISFDMDVMDPMFAPGVGIPLPGGLHYREALFLMEEMNRTGMVCSAEFVELNPVLDIRNQTAHLVVELIGRLLGETLY